MYGVYGMTTQVGQEYTGVGRNLCGTGGRDILVYFDDSLCCFSHFPLLIMKEYLELSIGPKNRFQDPYDVDMRKIRPIYQNQQQKDSSASRNALERCMQSRTRGS